MEDEISVYWLLLLQLALILVNAVFACAEIAVISINDSKLERMAAEGDRRAQRLNKLMAQPARFLATIQVGITLAGFLGSAFAADNFSHYVVAWLQALGVGLSASTLNAIALVVITLILSYFTLVLGELVPKRLAMQKAERLGMAMSGLIYWVAQVFRPIVWLLTASTNGILRLFRIDPNADGDEVTEEEIRMMVDVGMEKGTIDIDERRIINNVFELDNTAARDIMTHRRDMQYLDLNEDDVVWENKIMQYRHSVLPICRATADDVSGILNVKDYFRQQDRRRESLLREIVKEPFFVPENMRADILMEEMQQRRCHFAVVVDEYGGVSGIVTMNDILETLVGNLEDEAGQGRTPVAIVREAADVWLIRGEAALEDVAKALSVELPVDDYDTFGGFVFGELGMVPHDGAKPVLENRGLHIQVLTVRNHRMVKARVTKTAPAA